jgi:hypothetical protein
MDSDEDEPPDALCEDCGEPMDMTDVNGEAFEATGRLTERFVKFLPEKEPI